MGLIGCAIVQVTQNVIVRFQFQLHIFAIPSSGITWSNVEINSIGGLSGQNLFTSYQEQVLVSVVLVDR